MHCNINVIITYIHHVVTILTKIIILIYETISQNTFYLILIAIKNKKKCMIYAK